MTRLYANKHTMHASIQWRHKCGNLTPHLTMKFTSWSSNKRRYNTNNRPNTPSTAPFNHGALPCKSRVYRKNPKALHATTQTLLALYDKRRLQYSRPAQQLCTQPTPLSKQLTASIVFQIGAFRSCRRGSPRLTSENHK